MKNITTDLRIQAAAFRIPVPYIDDFNDQISLYQGPEKNAYKLPWAIPKLPEDLSLPWVTHNFWCLTKVEEGKETIIMSVHGLAAEIITEADGNKSSRAVTVGGTNDLLQIYWVPAPWATEADKQLAGWTQNAQTDNEQAGLRDYWTDAREYEIYTVYGNQEKPMHVLKRWKRLEASRQYLNELKVPYPAYGIGIGLGQWQCTNSNAAYTTLGHIMEVPIHDFKHWQPGLGQLLLSQEALTAWIEELKSHEDSL